MKCMNNELCSWYSFYESLQGLDLGHFFLGFELDGNEFEPKKSSLIGRISGDCDTWSWNMS